MESDTLSFLKELPKSFREIGAVFPSSRSLAKSLTRPVRVAKGPLRILEVGPGTGPITRQILRFMHPQDTLVISELNENFITRLQQRLEKFPPYWRHRDRVTYVPGPVQAMRGQGLEQSFDAIISSLPFSNFEPETVSQILNLFSDLLSPQGTITFYEYLGLRRLNSMVRPAGERARAKAVDEVVTQWVRSWKQTGHVKRDITFLNVPPAMTLEFVRPGQPLRHFWMPKALRANSKR